MKVQIQTTQNVEIEYDLATVGERIGAAVIDILILFGYVVGVNMIITPLAQSMAADGNDGFTIFAIYLLAVMVPIIFYHPICEIFMDGQSFGKKALQIKVVRLDGGQPGISAYLLRWLLGLVELTIFSGAPALITVLSTRHGQRIGDLAAGTTVVKVKRNVTLAQTIFAKVEEGYEPTFTTSTRLNDRDIAIIKQVITSRERASNPVILGTLTRKVKEVLGTESELQPLKFLRTVVKDYNYYASR